MSKAAKQQTVRVANLLLAALNDLRDHLEEEGEEQGDYLQVNVMVAALLWNLCGAVMSDQFWEQRQVLFDSLAGLRLTDSVATRQRLDELLDGLHIRADYWKHN